MSWHENGQKKAEVNWQNGKQQGSAIGWNNNGVMIAKLVGKMARWKVSIFFGMKMERKSEGSFKENKKHGLFYFGIRTDKKSKNKIGKMEKLERGFN